jgi:hypothetical protein
LETITNASFTLGALLLYAIGRVNVQQIFDRDPYESRRTAVKGSRLLKVLVFYQLLAAPSARGLVDAIEDSLDAQAALGGTVARNTLSNALSQRDLEQMIEGRDVPARSLQSLPSEEDKGREVFDNLSFVQNGHSEPDENVTTANPGNEVIRKTRFGSTRRCSCRGPY